MGSSSRKRSTHVPHLGTARRQPRRVPTASLFCNRPPPLASSTVSALLPGGKRVVASAGDMHITWTRSCEPCVVCGLAAAAATGYKRNSHGGSGDLWELGRTLS